MAGLTFNIFGHDVSASSTLRRVEGQADASASRIGSSFKKLGAVVGGAFAATKVFDFLKDSVSEASDLNETVSKSNQIFGRNAKAVQAWASTAATNLGLSTQAALDSATSFGDMFHQIGFTSNAAKDMSEKVVQMATDLGSFNNLPTGDVLDMIAGGFRGEYDSLQRVIPNISAARVQQEALNETHKQSVNDLTAAEKAQATLNIIMKDGSKAVGDFSRTSGGLANQQKIMSAQWSDLQAKIGTMLLPVLVKLAGFITEHVVPAIQSAVAWVQKHKEGFIQTGKAIVTFSKYLYDDIVHPILNAVVPAVKSIVGWIQKHKEGLQQLARFLGGGMKTAIDLIVGVIKFWIKQIKMIHDAVMDFWHNGVEPAAHGIVTAWHGISTAAKDVWGALKDVFGKIRGAFNDVKSFVKSAVDVINGAFHAVGDGLKWAWDHTLGPVINLIQGALDQIRDSIEWISTAGTSNVKHGAGTLVGNAPPVPVPGKATGGRVLAGQAYRVFDSPRPELFMPDSNGHIIPDASGLMNRPTSDKVLVDEVRRQTEAIDRQTTFLGRRLAAVEQAVNITIDGYRVDTAIGRRADRLSRGG